MKSDDQAKKDTRQEKMDDVVFEEENNETADVDLRGKVKELRAKLKEAESKAQEYLIGWQRAKADLINARKQDEESKKDFIKFANENLVGDIVPVLESFNMAVGNKESWEKVDKGWRNGIEYIFNQLTKVLGDNGLFEINPIGQKFDPTHHEAIEYVSVPTEKQDDIILEIVQKGYSLNGKVLKPAKVKVGEYKK